MTQTDLYESIVRRIADLSEESLQQLSEYIAFLTWQEEQWREWDDDELRFEPGDEDDVTTPLAGRPRDRKASCRERVSTRV